MLEMSKRLAFPFCYICLILLLNMTTPTYALRGISQNSSLGHRYDSDVPVNMTEWRFQITEINGRLDLMVDILYSYNFTGDERLTSATLLLSLDNESFVQAQRHDFDPSLMPATGTGGFYFANAIGDPLPFDVFQGNILYGYVEFTTTTAMYTSPRVAHEIPIDVIRPFLFRIPPSLFYIGGIMAGIFPLVIIVYFVTRKRNR